MSLITAANAFSNGRACWIWSEEGAHRLAAHNPQSGYRVRRFRRTFELSPALDYRAILAVSADSRYVLYCNGHRVGRGPAKGDVHHQFFDLYELTPWLVAGKNVIAVLVVNFTLAGCIPPELGAPASIMTYAGGLAVDGAVYDAAQCEVEALGSNADWRVECDSAYDFHNDNNQYGGFVGYFERFRAKDEPCGWLQADFNDAAWPPACSTGECFRFENRRDSVLPYGLMSRIIPSLEEEQIESFVEVFLPGGGACDAALREGLLGKNSLRIEAGQRVTCILDAGRLTTAFPLLDVEGGCGSTIRLTYAEALRLPHGTPGAIVLGGKAGLERVSTLFMEKDAGWTLDRRGKIGGWCDYFEPSGARTLYEPLHWRTFQFIELEIETGAEALTLHGMQSRFTAYPFEIAAEFESSDAKVNRVWDVSLRTFRLCCHETFEDCPYYEQLQYAGDTEITSRLAMALTGDVRLTQQALLHFDWSRLPEGITQSRYPSRIQGIIPSWSLHWIAMIHDYFMYSGDAQLVAMLLPGVNAVLDWFRRHCNAAGLPVRLPHWVTADWCPQWERGQVPGWRDKPSCIISAQYLRGLEMAAGLERACGLIAAATEKQQQADALRLVIRQTFWNEVEGLFADCPGMASFSQYGNAWAIAADIADADQLRRLQARFPQDDMLAPASFFGLHFVMQALRRLELKGAWVGLLGEWEQMLAAGLSTWAEDIMYWRSMCHAWSSHPALECLEHVLGISAAAKAFAAIRVAPQPGELEWAQGTCITPHGPVTVHWRMTTEHFQLEIDSPEGIPVHVVAPTGETDDFEGGSYRNQFERRGSGVLSTVEK